MRCGLFPFIHYHSHAFLLKLFWVQEKKVCEDQIQTEANIDLWDLKPMFWLFCFSGTAFFCFVLFDVDLLLMHSHHSVSRLTSIKIQCKKCKTLKGWKIFRSPVSDHKCFFSSFLLIETKKKWRLIESGTNLIAITESTFSKQHLLCIPHFLKRAWICSVLFKEEKGGLCYISPKWCLKIYLRNFRCLNSLFYCFSCCRFASSFWIALVFSLHFFPLHTRRLHEKTRLFNGNFCYYIYKR